MTYNIASGHYYGPAKDEAAGKAVEQGVCREGYDLSRCAGEIVRIGPDICGLNEVDNFRRRTGCISQLNQLEQATGLKGFFGPALQPAGDGQYGNAVLSRFPILETEVIPIPDADPRDEHASYESRSVTRVKLDVAGTPVTVLQTHFGLAIAEHQNAQQTVLRLLDAIDGPLLLMGDFNIRPKDFLLDPIRQRLQDTAALHDGYFKTFPSYPCNYPDCKIDYVFVSRHFTPLRLEIPQTMSSDHLPYVVEVEL